MEAREEEDVGLGVISINFKYANKRKMKE